LYFGSEWFVGGAKGIAEEFNVSERIIGITLVALGTSLPELVTSLIAAYKRDTDMALGGLLGSNIFNIFSILGITSLIQEIRIAPQTFSSDMYWMLGVAFLVFPMMILQRRISWPYAIVLLGIYAGYTYLVLA
ncbi:MAG: sodium:calcium antiporter, partial [Bacteroidota bacterium]